MSAPAASVVVREILDKYPNLEVSEIVKRVKARGVTSNDKSIQTTVYSERKKLLNEGKIAPAAARTTSPSKPADSTAASKPEVSAAPVVGDPSGVFANVKLVNKVVDASGGVANARAVAEAVTACGGVDAFLQHLELVAVVRGAYKATT